jgi:hypothetical protein
MLSERKLVLAKLSKMSSDEQALEEWSVHSSKAWAKDKPLRTFLIHDDDSVSE